MSNAPRNIEEFATAVVAVARPHGESGLVLISRAFAAYSAKYSVPSLQSFKKWLWVAAREGLLQLASHDMAQLLTDSERADSLIEQGASTFHLLRV